jgi:hypothetical protein
LRADIVVVELFSAAPLWRRVHRLVRPRSADEWKKLRVVDGFNCQIDIEIGPVKMVGALQFDVYQLPDTCFSKPRKVRERQETLFVSD